jgi:formylglycine-generating enzyme required for sulfatase activity
VLIDFGSARLSVGATMTMTSIVTHGYSPAEQYQTKGKMGPWTDIYALGAVMCRAITGEKPPVASDRLMDDDFQWLSYRQPAGFSTPLRQAVDWALRVRPEERPKSIAEWETHLRGAGGSLLKSGMGRMPLPQEDAGGTPAPRSQSEVPRAEFPEAHESHTPTKRKSQYTLIAVVAGIVLLGTLLATGMVVQSREANKRATATRLAENQKAAEQSRLAQKAAATAKAEADEQARLAREAEAARQAAEQARQAREAEAARKVTEEQRLAQEDAAAKAEASKKATKESPFENTLGMKFAPVPGTDVLFSIWDTRVKDYATFVSATHNAAGDEWKSPGFPQTPNDPVVNVSWDDAKAFCQWLTSKERGEGKISGGQEYRLPTDAEWSIAVGLPPESGSTPKEKDAKVRDVYIWGTQWPPPRGAGNYGSSLGVDSFDKTSPVGSFATNRFGLCDMGGNVWQWCEDLYSDGGTSRVVRGESWSISNPMFLLSSFRNYDPPGFRSPDYGFRCVLVGGSTR